MKNLKIGKKLLVTFGSIILLFLIVVIVSLYGLVTNGAKFQSFYENGYNITNTVMDIRRAIQSSAKNIGYTMMTTDPEKSNEYVQAARAETDVMVDGCEFMREHFRGDQALVEGFNDSLFSIRDAREQVYELALANKNEEASELYFAQVLPGYLKGNEYLTQIYDIAKENADTNYNASKMAVTMMILALAVLSLAALLITVFLAVYITRGLTRPIKEIEAAAQTIAKGNLDAAISYESKDELGSLSNNMREMTSGLKEIIGDIGHILRNLSQGNFTISSSCLGRYQGDYVNILSSMRELRDNLNGTLLQINQSADQVASGSEQVSSGSQALSQGATEQASSVEELAATINDISSQVKENAQRAMQGSELAETAGNKIEEGNRQMQELIAAMSDISDKSGQIGKIIKTIEDIAFQTNILALNAAVEAARAGEAGKGFAVVADEVRDLASKSADASKSTAVLIEGSIQAVDRGTKLADETAHTLTEVVESARQVVAVVDGISSASNEQASSITQVTQGIDQISSVVQTNSATAEESAAASEELSGQAQILKSLVEKFQLLQSDERSYTSDSSSVQPKEYSGQAAPNAEKY